jgi:pyruvate, water dikinase
MKLSGLFNMFRDKLRQEVTAPGGESIFHQKFSSFQNLLLSNNKALSLIADLENTFYQDKPFTYIYVLTQSENLIRAVHSIVEDINALSGVRYPDLFDTVEDISARIRETFQREKKLEETDFVIPLERLGRENADEVGGKAANLGEVYNRAQLPVPLGFAVTAFACHLFFEENRLWEFIENTMKTLDVNDTEKLMDVSDRIRDKILNARMPDPLARDILAAAEDLKRKIGAELRLAVRSSATSEDGAASFAGQHSTELNVTEENLLQAYREVVSSTFNPRAIFYRRSRGYMDRDVIMSVACITMVDAVSAGVMYTVDPNDAAHGVLMISAVWGLAAEAVEGAVETDFFQVDKKSRTLEKSEIAPKKIRLDAAAADGLQHAEVSAEDRNLPCLTEAQIQQLVEYGIKLEGHYQSALDIEWAIDRQGKIFILQARPLKENRPYGQETESDEAPAADTSTLHPVILQGGATAAEGAAWGRAFVAKTDHNLHHIPQDAILVAKQTTPRYVPLMGRIKGIITDVGSVTGHMASVAREFRIPTLVGTGNGTDQIRHGDEITLDATHKTIYAGRVESLLKDRKKPNPMKDSPLYRIVQRALRRIAPLNLTDPSLDNFSPAGCRSLHDIIRFAHEMAMREMFRITDDFESGKKMAIPLRLYINLPILVIDLGDGLSVKPDARFTVAEDVISIPFAAMIRGMKHEGIDWTRNVGIDLGGFASIVAESVFQDPMKAGRMGEPSYVVVARHYLNFSSRLGYHFATVDTYCGPEMNDNYITFHFKGGAADIGRRSRRAQLIAKILRGLRFKVDQNGDMIRGEIKKYEQPVLEEKLDMIGRLLGSVRLLDMVLSEDRQVDWYVEEFFKGNYKFSTQ